MSGISITVLWSDMLFGLLLLILLAGIWVAVRHPQQRRAWHAVFVSPMAMSAATLLGAMLLVAVLDSLHYRPALEDKGAKGEVRYSVEVLSAFDALATHLREQRETAYSRPFAYLALEKKAGKDAEGRPVRTYPRLAHGGAHLKDPERERWPDVMRTASVGIAGAACAWGALLVLASVLLARRERVGLSIAARRILAGETRLAWNALFWTLGVLLAVFVPLALLSFDYHVFGTDLAGGDVFYSVLKAIRTGLLIGTLATLVVLPLGVGLGLTAGYFGGWIDDLIQYLYTVISSIPYVLLIAAAVLMMQVAIETHPEIFDSAASRADARLVALCLIIGAISWTTLCRLVRAETLKLRELDYVQAARCFGVSPLRIMARHILPNAFHLVLINTVMEFSYLVLAEAVLSFVGVGVDPSTLSFGTMINAARSELAREPMVWWSIAAAFVFMVTLVLAANLLADAVRDAFDPQSRHAVRRRLRRRVVA